MKKLPRIVADTKIGNSAKLKVWRDGEEETFTIEVAELDEKEEEESATLGSDKPVGVGATQEVLGLELAALNSDLRQQYGLPADKAGLLVISVKEDSEAARQDVREGDLIQQIGGVQVDSLDGAKEALSTVRKASRKNALIRLERDGENVFITLPVDEKKK